MVNPHEFSADGALPCLAYVADLQPGGTIHRLARAKPSRFPFRCHLRRVICCVFLCRDKLALGPFMKLVNAELYESLLSKGVSHLFHANTVATSTSFVLAGGLLSRGDVERRNIFQTPQSSDDDDRKFDVWNDVFLDAEDLHEKFKRQNKYGPVLFRFGIEFLLRDDLDVWITKNNPIYWREGQASEDRYFQSATELMRSWDEPGSQQRMFTIRKPGGPVLFPYLDAIILDYFDGNVYAEQGLHAGTITEHALFAATDSFRSLRSMVKRRECGSRCYCAENFSSELSDLERARLFCPRDLIHSGRDR